MPVYEYACTACGHDFEARRAMNQESPSCPKCGASPRRRISMFAAAMGPAAATGGGCACGGSCGCAN